MAVFLRPRGTNKEVFCYKKNTLTLIRIKRIELITGKPSNIEYGMTVILVLGKDVSDRSRLTRSLFFICPVKFSYRFLP